MFGALRGRPDLPELLRRTGLAPGAERVIDTICEWAPQPPSAHLGDRTAFDAMVRYEDARGGESFVAVETKYTEPFSPTIYCPDRYRDVTRECGWFRDPVGAPDRLKAPASNQLWRMALLAGTVEQNSATDGAAIAVVCTAGDRGAEAAVAAVRSELNEPDRRVRCIALEDIVAVARDLGDGLAAWAARFERRYLATYLPDLPIDV